MGKIFKDFRYFMQQDETRPVISFLWGSHARNQGHIDAIFWTVTGTSLAALGLTLVSIPFYTGHTLDAADMLARD